MKKLALAALLLPAMSQAAPFLVSDPTTQTVTHCGLTMDTAAKVDYAVETVAGGKRCKVDLASVSGGAHTAKLTFVNIDPTWGRSESVDSAPFSFTKPTLSTAPSSLVVAP